MTTKKPYLSLRRRLELIEEIKKLELVNKSIRKQYLDNDCRIIILKQRLEKEET